MQKCCKLTDSISSKLVLEALHEKNINGKLYLSSIIMETLMQLSPPRSLYEYRIAIEWLEAFPCNDVSGRVLF